MGKNATEKKKTAAKKAAAVAKQGSKSGLEKAAETHQNGANRVANDLASLSMDETFSPLELILARQEKGGMSLSDPILQLPLAASDVHTELDRAWTRSAHLLTLHYEAISVFSSSWMGDDSGGNEDSQLFIDTTKILPAVSDRAVAFQIPSDYPFAAFISRLMTAFQSLTRISGRKLFIVHYAGHAEAGSTSEALVLVRHAGDGDPDSKASADVSDVLPFNLIKQIIKTSSSGINGFDLLYVMDCCCSALGGRGPKQLSRVEFVAATTAMGISNARSDGTTLTQMWCKQFSSLVNNKVPFTAKQIVVNLQDEPTSDGFPAIFLIEEGRGAPILFHPSPVLSSVPSKSKYDAVVAFHVLEEESEDAFKKLSSYISESGIPVSVIAVIPTSSVLLLLLVPFFMFQAMQQKEGMSLLWVKE